MIGVTREYVRGVRCRSGSPGFRQAQGSFLFGEICGQLKNRAPFGWAALSSDNSVVPERKDQGRILPEVASPISR